MKSADLQLVPVDSKDGALRLLGRAETALAECRTVMEAKEVSDIATAMEVYLQRTHASVEAVNRATEVRLLAERQMGEFLKAMPKNVGAKGSKVTGSVKLPVKDPAPTLTDIGITKKQSASTQKLAAIPEPEFRRRLEEGKASGRLSAASVLNTGFSAKAVAAGEEAERDSEKLWAIKVRWRALCKRDRLLFLEWIKSQR